LYTARWYQHFAFRNLFVQSGTVASLRTPYVASNFNPDNNIVQDASHDLRWTPKTGRPDKV
jgi:hypothetical protein